MTPNQVAGAAGSLRTWEANQEAALARLSRPDAKMSDMIVDQQILKDMTAKIQMLNSAMDKIMDGKEGVIARV